MKLSSVRSDFSLRGPISTALLAGVLVAGAALPGVAADLPSRRAPPVYVPPPLPSFTWTGFYVGATAGGMDESTSVATTAYPGTHLVLPANLARVSGAASLGGSRVGFVGGGEVGYNYQVNPSFVLGIEADAEYLGGRKLAGIGSGTLTTGNAFTVSTASRADFMTTVRGRAGFAVDRALFYATGGVAFVDRRLAQSYFDTLFVPTLGSTSSSNLRVGFAVGGGVEYAFAPNWSVKGEYLFVRETGGAAYTITSNIGSSNLISVRDRRDLNIGRIGVNYRFNTLGPAPVVARY